MSWVGQALLSISNWRNNVNKIKQDLKKEETPLRIGVLSAAAINYTAIIDPVQTHPGAILTGIAARERSKAQAQIDSNNLGPSCKAFGSYAELLQDPNIQAVYIPLPNGLHTEWAIKAMEAGKHVLIEKPITSNAEEVRRIQEVAKRTNKVAVEAFHWRFHPAAHTLREMLQSEKYGKIQSIFARLQIPGGALKKGDIRYQYSLAGGACMDLAYVFSACSFFASPDIAKCNFNITSTAPRIHTADKNIDEAMESKFTISQPGQEAINCSIRADMNPASALGFIPKIWELTPLVQIETEKAKIQFSNFVVPTFGHSISVTEKDSGKKTTTQVYTGGPWWKEGKGEKWWTTYRYQLEAFVDAVRAKEAGKEYEGPWVTLGESEKLMELVDKVYDKAELPRRGL